MQPVIEFKKDNLLVKVFENRENMGKAAAQEFSAVVNSMMREKPYLNIVFGAAPSQNEFLNAVVEDKNIEFSKINAFHMDEYIGLNKDAPQKFSAFLKRAIFDKVEFNNVHYFRSIADPEEECERYSELIRQMPPDIVCMGIGQNGHIAFIEPDEADFFDQKLVKIVRLDEVCRKQQVDDGCFKNIDDVPEKAMTMTIPALMRAKYIFCMVPSAEKAIAVRNAIMNNINEKCPASILRIHQRSVLFLDKDSSNLLTKTGVAL